MLTVIVYVAALAIGAALGLFTFVQLSTLLHAEVKSTFTIVKLIIGIALIVVGIFVSIRIPS